MKATITKTDLKKALAHTKKHGWNGNHCLIAQTAKRLRTGWVTITRGSEEAQDLMDMFDRAQRSPVYPNTPPEQSEMDLAMINAVLPMKIEF